MDNLPSRYQLADVIGSGSTSRVYRAHDTTLDKPCAVKILKTGSDAKIAARLVREAKAMASIRHPNILPVYDTGMLTDGRAWIVMELAEETLASRIAASGPIPMSRLLLLGIHILEGLQAAHDAGVIHRDVKPQNVLLTQDDRALLGDFGIAAITAMENRDTDVGTSLGTFAYMPPEQRTNARDVGPQADQYAAAATLYQALTAANPVDLFAVPADSERWQGVPKPLGDALRRALSYKPSDRFPSCRDMADCLRALRNQTGMMHEPVVLDQTLTPAPERRTPPPTQEPTTLTAALEHIYRHSLSDRLQGLLDTRDSALRGNQEARTTLSRIAHSLRGSGATYGFPEITERAGALEDALDQGNEPIDSLLNGLTNAVRTVLTQTTGDKHRVLIAVADPVASSLLQAALQRADRAISAVDTVSAARDSLSIRPVAGAVIDLVLPDADGRLLLDDPRLREVPTIVIASGVNNSLRAELMARGASAVYSKPLDPVGVASAMASLLAKSRATAPPMDTLTGLPSASVLRDALVLAHGSTAPDHPFSVAHIYLPEGSDLALWSIRFEQAMSPSTLVARLGPHEIGAMVHGDVRSVATEVSAAIQHADESEAGHASAGIAPGGGMSVADVLVAAARMARHASEVGLTTAVAHAPDRSSARVLLAEDDPATAALVVRLLGEDGMTITRASHGDRAKQLVSNEHFDLMLFDVHLPGCDGFTLLSTARSLPHQMRTPVVMLTAVGDERQVARAFELGADDYIVKPFRPLELQARVRRLLRKPQG